MRIAAGQFKARCLQLMDQVQTTREEIVITKRGRPVARLVPEAPQQAVGVYGCMADTVEIVGDIISPLSEVWNAES